jgi:hypothetical protein
VVALVLSGRRQWHAEQAHRATEQSHQAAEHDATQRRITDLYTKAVEQLGSEKAPVLLGGLYALERVAQDNPGQRQTIVNVICAYLRMPYTPPAQAPADDAPEPKAGSVRNPHPGTPGPSDRPTHPRHPPAARRGSRPARPTFRPDINLDFTGAALIDFDLIDCRPDTAQFDRATFAGHTRFNGAQFAGIAWCDVRRRRPVRRDGDVRQPGTGEGLLGAPRRVQLRRGPPGMAGWQKP